LEAVVIYVLHAVHVIVCLFLILVVLLQQGKGADLSVFGGGGTMAAFGARGATTLLHKLTVASFVLFIVTTLAIAVSQGRNGSVMSGSAATGAPSRQASPTPASSPAGAASPVPSASASPSPAKVPSPSPTASGTPKS
jgi:preprotein translocase subunit SecG